MMYYEPWINYWVIVINNLNWLAFNNYGIEQKLAKMWLGETNPIYANIFS